MDESGRVISFPYSAPGMFNAVRAQAQLTFCYQCHCAVDLRASTPMILRSGHWTRVGTCAHCGTTITRILKQAS
jgi:hypothetical protein